jgi:hypothetical protein
LALSPGTETRLETTTSRANTDPHPLRPAQQLNISSEIVHGFLRAIRPHAAIKQQRDPASRAPGQAGADVQHIIFDVSDRF